MTEKSISNAIIVCGNTGVGKSYLCNRIFCHFNSIHHFESSGAVTRVTGSIQQGAIVRNGVTFTIVDTPGFFDTDDPSRTDRADGENMCTLVKALESCHQIFALVFMFTDRFSLPHKVWYDRIKDIVTSGRIGHILLVHNKLGSFDHTLWAENTRDIQTTLGNECQSSYHWLSYNAPESQIQELMDKIANWIPFTLRNIAIPEMCYESEETGPEYEEVIAEATKDEGHSTQLTRDTHYMVTDVCRGERRYLGLVGPKEKVYVNRWVQSTSIDNVWVPKMVTRRLTGVYRNIYKIRFDGTRDFSRKLHCRSYEVMI